MGKKNILLVFICAFTILILVSCGSNSQSSSNTESIPEDALGKIASSEDAATTQENANQTDTGPPPTATPTSTPAPKSKATPVATPRAWIIPTAMPVLTPTRTPTPTPQPVTKSPTTTISVPTPNGSDTNMNMEECKEATGKMVQACMDMALELINSDPQICDTATGMLASLCMSTSSIPKQPTTYGKTSGDVSNPCVELKEPDRSRCEESFKNNPDSKPTETTGNDSSEDTDPANQMAQNYDPNNLPKVAKSNFTELDKFSRMTKLRSGVGHDFSNSSDEYDPTHSNCKSMKTYLMPVGVPLEMEAYATTPHTFRWMSIKFFSPVDGTLTGIYYSENAYGIEARFTIASSEYPGYNFMFFHVALDPDLKEGSVVQAGQQIATLGAEDTWSEIAVTVNVGPGDQRLLSFLQIASDEVLQEYKARGINDASDVIIPREQRDANPLACDDSEAGWFIGSGRGGTTSDMSFITWQFESSDNWFFFD